MYNDGMCRRSFFHRWDVLEPRRLLAASFSAAPDVVTPDWNNQIVAGDFNTDGKVDLVSFRQSGDVSRYLFFGDGDGTFSAPMTGNAPAFAAVVGNFNGDDHLDVMIAHGDTVYGLYGNGLGVLTHSSQTSTVGNTPRAIASGDFNRDGKIDLVTANEGDDNISILIGIGSGYFAAPVNLPAGDRPWGVTVADFNNDRFDDIAVANLFDNNLSIWLNNGAGGFNAATDVPTNQGPADLSIGDFNGDGNVDLLIAHYFAGNVGLALGDGAGGFGAIKSFNGGDGERYPVVADFDGDGRSDFVVVNSFSNNMSVFTGDGAGGFSQPLTLPVGRVPAQAAVGDFNGDGRPDIAVGNANDNLISIYLNTSPPSITGTLFNDPNSNGIQDAGEEGLNQWTVYLDTNNNGLLDDLEPNTVTDAHGHYGFAGLANITYHVKQIQPIGFRKTLPKDVSGYSVTLDNNRAADLNFGNTSKILLAGYVFNDANSNGTQDGGELGIGGATVNIISDGQIIATRTTDANGFWQVKGSYPGTGSAQLELPAGYAYTHPAGGRYDGTMTAGQQNASLNFGLRATPLAAAPAVSFARFSMLRIGVPDVWLPERSELLS